jgi:hypothetical protein
MGNALLENFGEASSYASMLARKRLGTSAKMHKAAALAEKKIFLKSAISEPYSRGYASSERRLG